MSFSADVIFHPQACSYLSFRDSFTVKLVLDGGNKVLSYNFSHLITSCTQSHYKVNDFKEVNRVDLLLTLL